MTRLPKFGRTDRIARKSTNCVEDRAITIALVNKAAIESVSEFGIDYLDIPSRYQEETID